MKISYEELLDRIDAKSVLFSEHCPSDKGKTLLLRHDIDGQFDKSVWMAEWEETRGIKATYFILPTAPYFEYTDRFADECKYIQDCGHEIGIHNNALREYLENNTNYKKTLEWPLMFLRECGIDVKGTSAHYYDNCQMWREFNSLNHQKNYDDWTFPKVSLSDYDLEYETYLSDYDVYLTDSGRYFSGMIVPEWEVMPSELELRYSEKNRGLDVLNHFNQMSNGTIQVLVHPQSWKLRDNQWLFKQRKLKPYIPKFK